jgi:TatD DNase family protein
VSLGLVDSHCHLDLLGVGANHGGLDGVVATARASGVTHMLCVGVTLERLQPVIAVAERYPGVFASVGVHPNERGGDEPEVERLVALSRHPRVVAIGETGLDYYRSKGRGEGDLSAQDRRFRRHIAAARASGVPLIIHSRAAAADTLRLLHEEGAERVGGVMHCFSEDWPTAVAALDLGFYLSISGIVTFPTASTVHEVARRVPLDRLLVETDSPWLAPVPHRGRPNQPAYVRYVAEHVARLREVPFEEVARATTENFFRLFDRAIPSVSA